MAEKVLRHLGLDATGPPVAKARKAPEPVEAEPAQEDEGVDPIYEE